MTEAEWLACDSACEMTKALPQPLPQRKTMLVVCGYGRHIERHIPPALISPELTEYESGADQSPPLTLSLNRWLASSQPQSPQPPSLHFLRSSFLWCLCTAGNDKPYIGVNGFSGLRTAITNVSHPDLGNDSLDPQTHSTEWQRAWNEEALAQSAVVRDVFGNPFHPVACDPAWLTSDVLALARGIYDERAFDRMPILADALQDAGCTNDDVLSHCRNEQAHVRGCWVVDLLLGKA